MNKKPQWRIRNATTVLLAWTMTVATIISAGAQGGDVIDLGNRRELFVDDYLIDKMNGLELRLATPVLAQRSTRPPPRSSVYSTIVEVDGIYHYYTRGNVHQGERDDLYKYAYYYYRSEDGLNWEKSDLGLFPRFGAGHENMILEPHDPITHNFSPFYDTRHGVPDDERFKGLGGGGKSWSAGTGLYGLVSADGVHWRRLQEAPVIPEGKTSEHYFDSQPAAFWSETEQCYVCYYRTWLPKVEGRRGIRSVSRSVSKDFVNWSEGVLYPVNEEDEQFYTNATFSYFRAHHIYLTTALRYIPWSGGDIHRYPSDVILLSARGEAGYVRTFQEAFIRPGRNSDRWRWPNPVSGSPTLGLLQTAEDELSLYIHDQRYTLRMDGFASLHAGAGYGEMVTKPLRFEGNQLEINMATSAAGRIRIEILDAEGNPFQSFALDDMRAIVGDEIAHTVVWKDSGDLGELRGKEVRLRFQMRDSDLYSIRFR